MFHKIKEVTALDGFLLSVQFAEGVTKIYDINPLFKKWEAFNKLKDENFFDKVHVDVGGYGISWDEELDISCDELFNKGKEV